MEVAKLGLIFCIIVVIIWLKYPLYLAMTAGILGAILLFQIPVTEALLLLGRQTIIIGRPGLYAKEETRSKGLKI